MDSITFDYIVFPDTFTHKPKRKSKSRDSIENIDGDIMYVSSYVSIDKEREVKKMTMQSNSPLTFKGALGIAGASLLLVGTVLWAAYVQIQSQISNVRGEISELRSTTHNDMNRVADKLDDINKTLTVIQVDLATQKAKSEKSN